MKKIRVIELFAGYGSQHNALKRLKRDYPQFEYEVVAFCEIDENAIKAYHALHGDHIPNLGDITQVNPSDVPDCALMTWSFPCQSISSAGLQHGLAEGSGTRSSLCWNAVRIFEAKRPKYLLMENVSALVSDKFIGDFNLLQSSLQKIGYTNFTQLMNAKDYGVPQNRLRVFMVSVLDCSQAYYFPKPFPLERRLKDVLETNVPDRYYLSQERLAGLKLSNEKAGDIQIVGAYNKGQSGVIYNAAGCSPTVDASASQHGRGVQITEQVQEPCVETVGQYDSSQNSRIIDPNGLSQAVINGHKDGTPKVIQPLPAAARGRAAGDWHTSQHNQTLELGDPAAANSVTSVAKDSMIVEPAILQQQRTEEGKEIRRQHKGDKGIPYAHKELSPRGDGITNTLSTVEKDNLLAEPTIIEDFYPDRPARVYEEQAPTIRSDRTGLKVTEPAVLGWTRSGDSKGDPTYHPVNVANCVTAAKRDNTQNYVVEPQVQQVCNLIGDREGKFANPQRGRIDSPAGLAPAVDTAQGGNLVAKIIEQAKTAHPSRGIIMIKNTPCWVRRLTERELFRLMDVDENDIDTLLNAGISNTQLAKLAGNSVVCACYYHIFHALFIETTPPPNTQTQLF